jgi:gliding motility-associated-like protein
MKQIILLLTLGLFFPLWGNAQLVVDNTTQTPEQLVQNVLLGQGVLATNITFNGAPANTVTEFAGYFDGSNSNVGLNSGLLLVTGDAQLAVGPNNNGGLTQGGGNFGQSDPDLDIIVTPNGTNDAAVLEFDFVPTGDTIRFRYVFGSEEYLEWVNSQYNDVFGFFISGPGFSGPYALGAENIALVPATTTPVSINNVNTGLNAAYYVDNGDGQSAPQSTDPTVVQFDGITTVLEAVAPVQCGQQYHIKLAIADAGDASLDSGVFLEGGSFSSSGVNVSAAAIGGNPVLGDSIIVEGCGAAVFTFFRPDSTSDFTIHFDIGGGADPGNDYTSIPDSIVIPQGEFTDSLVVDAFFDGISEGMEDITITLVYDNGCTGNDTIRATIYIQNVDPMAATATGDINICTPLEVAPLSVSATGGYGVYSYLWDNGAGVISDVTVVPPTTTTYTVTVTDECGNSVTSNAVTVEVQCEPLIPNVFTPNNDGQNETFFIINMDQYPNSRLIVYNRWGKIVYESANYQNDWNGGDLSDGVYYYVLYPSNEEVGPYHGNVSIYH